MKGNRIRIMWYGTASVRITAGSSQLLIDPFYPFADSKVKVSPEAFNGCRHILISHGHIDHIGSIHRIVHKNTTVYCTRTPYRTLRGKGIGEGNLRLIRPNSVITVGEFRITALKGKHIRFSPVYIMKAIFSRRLIINRKGVIRKLLKIAGYPEKNETLCYLVEAYGKRILILGSLSLDADTDYPKNADLALFPYQGSEKLPDIGKDVYRRLAPKAVLLTHFDDTFPPFSSDIDTSPFERFLGKYVPVYKLRHGGSLEI